MAPRGNSRSRTRTSSAEATPSRRQPPRAAKQQPELIPAVQEDNDPTDNVPTTMKVKKPSTSRSATAGRSSNPHETRPSRTPVVESDDDNDDDELHSQGSAPTPVHPRNTGKIIATVQPTGHPNISYGSAPYNVPEPLSTPSHYSSSWRGAKSFIREASMARVKSMPELDEGEPSERGDPGSSQVERAEIPNDPNGSESDFIRSQLAQEHTLAQQTVASFGIRPERFIDRLVRCWYDFVPYLEETIRWLLAIGIVLGFVIAILFALNGLSPNLLRPIKKFAASSPLNPIAHPNCSIRIDAIEQQIQGNWHAFQRQKDQTKVLLDDLRKDIEACLTKSKASSASIIKFTDRLQRLEETLSHTLSYPHSEPTVNFFSSNLGAKIDPRYTSPTLPRGTNIVRQILSRAPLLSAALLYPPTEALRPWQEAGQCWCAANDGQGVAQLAIAMPAAVVPSEFGIEHLAPSLALDREAKPAVVELWVKMDMLSSRGGNKEEERRGEEEWDNLEHGCLASPPAPGFRCVLREVFSPEAHSQSWFVKKDLEIERYGVKKAVVRVTENNGADYTCFYRVKLGGELRDGREVEGGEGGAGVELERQNFATSLKYLVNGFVG